MENNQKPEWFELADNDQPVSRKSKSKVSASARNLTFILAGILVIPLGAGFALLTHEDQSAIAAESITLTQESPVAASPAISQPNNTITMPTASRDDDEEGDDDERAPIFSNSSSTSPTAVANVAPLAPVTSNKPSAAKAPTAIKPPSSSSSKEIILPPTKKADDDDDDDEDDDDDDDEEDDD
jgi:cytoskeletal protein RodZ